MSRTIGPFRHVDVVAQLGPNGFEAIKGRQGRMTRAAAPVLDDAAVARSIGSGIAKGLDAAIAKLRVGNRGSVSAKVATETPDEFKDRIATAVQARRAATFRGDA